MEPWSRYSLLLQQLYRTPQTPTSGLLNGSITPSTQLTNYLLSGLPEISLPHTCPRIPADLLPRPPVGNSSNVKVTLDEEELWQRFHEFGTEMIVTRSGRRMFPILKVRIEGLDPQKKYCVMLTIVPTDEARYKFCNGRWAVSGRAEPHFPVRFFVHPDSPSTGKHWTEGGLVSFHRVKLTNNNKDNSGNILLNSMHRYIPRIHIVEADDAFSVQLSTLQTFSFPETAFFAVTAYQNENITQLKIDNNPFAKGFRDREKLYPQKRSAPFLEQLRKAATTEDASGEVKDVDSAYSSPEKADRPNPSHVTIDPVRFYASNKFDLYLQQQRMQMSQPAGLNMTSHPLFGMSLNKLPLLSQLEMPFNLMPNRTDT